MDYKEALVAKAAWYYYIENMTQQEISDKLGISRMKVIKLLETAKQNGIIQFSIAKDKSSQLEIEKKLREKYSLDDAYIIPSVSNTENLNDILAQAAASYIAACIDDGAFINMGYGDTSSKILNHLATMTSTPVSIVSMTGGVQYYLPNTVSSTFNAKLYLYPTPLLLSSKELCDAVKNEPALEEIKRMTPLASMSVVGMGSMSDDATIIKNGILSRSDFAYLSLQGAVGDILSHFIDKNGEPIHADLEARMISTSLSELKQLSNVVGVAGGANKKDIISATLRGGYLNVLITDEDTALSLI